MKKEKLPLNSEGVPSRNELSLNSFAGYCIENPNQRFFQALTNWFGAGYIGFSQDRQEWHDLWFLEENIDYKVNKLGKK